MQLQEIIRFLLPCQVRQLYNGTSSHITTATKEVVEHILAVVPVKPATCSATGTTEGVICSTHNSYECGAKGVVVPGIIPQVEHNDDILVHYDAVPAKCNATGFREHDTCMLCKKDFVNGVEIAHEDLIVGLIAHVIESFGEKQATCTEGGFTAGQRCKVCGKITEKQIKTPAEGHKYISFGGREATCTETGETVGKKCSVCAVVSVPCSEIPAKGHKLGEWVVNTPATESATGSKTRICTNDGCDYSETVEIPKLAHTCKVDEKATVVTKVPTCTAKGRQQKYCACGKAYGKAEDIPALGHKLTKVEGSKSTCQAEGVVEHYKCSVCGEAYKDENGKNKINATIEKIDKHNHTHIVVIPGVPATCVDKGFTAGEKCADCDVVTKKQKVVNQLAPHNKEIVARVEAGCATTGILEHEHCSVCNTDFIDGKEVKYFTIPAKGHTYGEVVVVTDSTETELGVGVQVCGVCGDEK